MGLLLGISRAIDAMNTVVHKIVMWLVLVAILVSAGNAIIRKVFSVSSNAYLELQWYLFSAVFLLAAGYALLMDEHVRIDLFFGRLSRTKQIWVEILGTIFFLFPFCFITIAIVWPVVVSKFYSGETSPNAGGLIYWPAWGLIPLGFTLLGLQGVSELIKRIAFLMGRAPDPAHVHTPPVH